MFEWLSSMSVEKAGYMAVAAVVSLFAPQKAMIMSLFMFIMLDLVLGVWAAKKRGELIESRKLKITVQKFGFGLICLFCAARLDMHLGLSGTASFANAFCLLIVGREFFSVLENMYSITGLPIYYILTQWTKLKIKDMTGQDIKEEKK